MTKVPQEKAQQKKNFILRNTPAWLLSHQEWISDPARKLYLAMRALADAKTGELAIPGRGDEQKWIKPRTIERKAGMCDETRKKYMRELIALGAVHFERKRITRRVGNRLRAFWGVARYTLLPLEPHQQRVSSTAKNSETATLEPQEYVSSTAKSSTAKAENDLLRPNSCAAQGIGHEVLSENTSSAAARRVGFGSVGCEEVSEKVGASSRETSSSSKSTTAKPDDDGSPEKEKIETLYRTHPKFIEWCGKVILRRALDMRKDVASPRRYISASLPSFLQDVDSIAEAYREAAGEIVPVTWETFERQLTEVCSQLFGPPAAKKTTPEPDDEPIYGHISGAMVRSFWEHAQRHGWSKEQTRSYLRSTFQVETPKRLSLQDYNVAYRHMHKSPTAQAENIYSSQVFQPWQGDNTAAPVIKTRFN